MEEQLAQREAELGRCRQELASARRILQQGAAHAAALGAAGPAQPAPTPEVAPVEGAAQSAIKRAASAGDKPKDSTPLATR